MLLLFRFKNYGPFKEDACLDMRAINAYKEHPHNVIDPDSDNSFLKVASIYGANASGKSSFIKAYNTFRNIVTESFTKNDKPHETDESSVLERNYYPFFFDSDSIDAPTEFEAVYISEGVEYRYGFTFNEKEIEYEWLYKKPLKSGRTSVIVERSPEEGIVLGSSVRKSLGKYKSDIDDDVLVLSFFSSLKLKTSVFSETLNCVTSVLPWYNTSETTRKYFLDFYMSKIEEEERLKLVSFVKAIDVGIKDIQVEKNNKNVEVFTYHLDVDGSLTKVPFSIESDGTKNAMALYSVLKLATDMDKAILIDEFNLQLHPLLVKYLINMFTTESTQSQLIYTTHDTTLLDKRYVRRDQVWFVEKSETGNSSLYSLAEFRVRNDASFEKDYLGGVYGGIPILKEFLSSEETHGEE